MHGIEVTLYVKTQTGVDGFNNPVYSEIATPVSNVLVNSSLESEVLSSVDLRGKKQVFSLAIPKGDTHDWRDVNVAFVYNGQIIICHTFGLPQEGLDELVPTEWNKKVLCERYE